MEKETCDECYGEFEADELIEVAINLVDEDRFKVKFIWVCDKCLHEHL